MKVSLLRIVSIGLISLALSCSTTGPGLFNKRTPHEQYSQKITDAGLKETALGRLWFLAADKSLLQPLNISIPYKETGYFAAERPQALGLRFTAKQGEKISITLTKKPITGFLVYMDLWQFDASQKKMLQTADTSGSPLEYEIEKDGAYILRIQPELLQSGEYTVSLSSGPSLAYPINAPGTNHIKSFWGADRDGGSRNHEGIDMFAQLRTPVVAAADGRVTNVSENNLGGKVIFMRPFNKNFSLYYAHLDQQLVQSGQTVKTGDTLGLMGNTGNAGSTAPHLHFGIYLSSGPIDPLPFVNPVVKKPGNIHASLINLGKYVRNGNKQIKIHEMAAVNGGTAIESNTLLRVEAATLHFYRIELPDGKQGYVNYSSVDVVKPLRSYKLTSSKAIFDKPDTLAAKKSVLSDGETVNILASFDGFYFITNEKNIDGWISK